MYICEDVTYYMAWNELTVNAYICEQSDPWRYINITFGSLTAIVSVWTWWIEEYYCA